ncbi:Pyrrolopyrazine biosynthesis cluster protein F [Fulvia fulva]|nr:Pyrrolopyrazine biosynthesis cluster protein F [Fulvia fulva]KAK4629933.1 Pyrrolopyrazine biosynthesis cluster protein F [Fulvia fulva]WPV27791.1 Pyrrolopyrazine biosynthesis cluster protein F [Fulvia fulva]
MGSIGDSRLAHRQTPRSDNIRDVFFFAHTRTASHVLCRLLSKQPGWNQSNYHFFHTFKWARKTFGFGPASGISPQHQKELERRLQEAFDEIQRARSSAAEENRCILLKEHTFYIWEPARLLQSMWGGPSKQPSFTVIEKESGDVLDIVKTNPTIFPDSFLRSWRPIFLIRHPAVSFESWYRAESGAQHVDITDKSWAFYTTFRYQRELYDWFLTNQTDAQSVPLIIDADDMLEDPTTINRLCELLNMDPTHVPSTWNAVEPEENASKRTMRFMGGYWESTTIDKSKSSRGLDIAKRYVLWQNEFGTEVADELLRLVEKATADYTYLKSRKI